MDESVKGSLRLIAALLVVFLLVGLALYLNGRRTECLEKEGGEWHWLYMSCGNYDD